MRTFRPVWAVALFLISIACTGEAPDEGDGGWHGTVETVGDVTTVRTEGGSVWPGAAEFAVDLAIGKEVGEEPYMFGRIQSVAATDDRILVLDAQVPVVRVYDHNGVHLLDIGEAGQGPGEFEQPTFMALDHLGNVFVHDQGRLEVFSPDGEFLDTWGLEGLNAFAWFNEGNIGLDGTAYVPVVVEREGIHPGTWKIGYTELREGVAGETRLLPELEYEAPVVEMLRQFEEGVRTRTIPPPFVPRRVWAISPLGLIVVGSGDHYRFEAHHPDGAVTVVEKPWDVVPVDGNEAAWSRDVLRAVCAPATEVRGWDLDSQLPEHKPAFAQLVPDENDRIWVFRSGPGVRLLDCNEDATDARSLLERPCWEESVLLDVFDDQGRYLGAVKVPEDFSGRHPSIIQPRPFIRDDIMIAAVEDESGTVMVKRYRLIGTS